MARRHSSGPADVLAALAGQRQPVPYGLDAQVGVGAGDQLQRGAGLLDRLVQGAEDVRVVELDGAHTGQSAEDAGQFGAVHAAHLGDPERQFAVTAGAGPVDQGVVGAQARAQHDLLGAQPHRRVHVVAVVVPVPGDLVQLPFAEHGRVHVPVPGKAFGLADVLLQGVPYDRAVGQPVRQAGADQRVGAEEAEFTAEAAVVGDLLVHRGSSAGPVGGARNREDAATPKPRGARPGAWMLVSCQRAGTVSGVVVLFGHCGARCIRGR